MTKFILNILKENLDIFIGFIVVILDPHRLFQIGDNPTGNGLKTIRIKPNRIIQSPCLFIDIPEYLITASENTVITDSIKDRESIVELLKEYFTKTDSVIDIDTVENA